LQEWKRRGLITSYCDALLQAFRIMHEKITEHDVKALQLKNLKEIDEE